MGTYFQESTGAAHARCPDGELNAWEVTVPNGVYTVTAGLQSDYLDRHGCTFENVRAAGTTGFSYVYSVEVSDGRFTLSAGPPMLCQAVSWLKLDLVSSKTYPKPWLPAPRKAWWQLELDDATADVGVVEVRLPHEGYTLVSAASVHSFEVPWFGGFALVSQFIYLFSLLDEYCTIPYLGTDDAITIFYSLAFKGQ